MAMPIRRLLQIQLLPGRSNWPETRGISMGNEDRIKRNQRYAEDSYHNYHVIVQSPTARQ